MFRALSGLLIFGVSLVSGSLVSQAAEKAVYPVVVEHKLGTTTIPEEPQRIVTLGWNGEDAVLSLGIKPIAMPRYGSFPTGIFPWNEELLGTAKPQLLSGDLDFEDLAALRPDLILGVYSGISELEWKRLSKIAPTVVYRSGPWAADWREVMIQTGLALGVPDQAEQLLLETDSFLRKLGEDHPVLQGKTFTFGTFFPGANSLVVYLPNDPRVAALIRLGLKPSSGVERLAKDNATETSVSVSLEQIGEIDADILIMWYREGARDAAEAQPLFQTLGVVKRGSYVALDDPVSVWSTSALSVLSIPYGFSRFIPRLAEAAAAAKER
ncbi:iron-siderophore ABC transporter substrate-binding protein [Brucella pseudogrignonensis]|uniref:iron-siderophore ABC transporter substrate-binding protein n=1 Tax=Brucella pseudogrignonensis TaxID=419475 RepID=UPI001E3AB173|nr:iron-siderophore ABC transporter substrate-binding protein [Brucella pseudogrignonensis]MCD4514291.1 iron-siderophore ABC transporter substrate-binding protein [Brucella pseudogrignonensis]